MDPERVFIAGSRRLLDPRPSNIRRSSAPAASWPWRSLHLPQSIPPDPAWQSEFGREVGDPLKDAALLRERSPFFHADKVKVPLKIWQAENDVRTVKAEMDAYTARLKELGTPVEYVVLAQEGHSIQRKENLEQIFQSVVDFFRKNL